MRETLDDLAALQDLLAVTVHGRAVEVESAGEFRACLLEHAA